MPKHAYFVGHLGLGDHITLQGAVNKLAPKYDGNFIIPCKPHSTKSLNLMIEQCSEHYDLSRIVVLPLRTESDKKTDPSKHITQGEQLPLSWRDNKINFYDHEARRVRGLFAEGKLDIAPEGGDIINVGVMEYASWRRLYKKWKSKYRCNAGKFFDRLFYHQLQMDHGESWNWEAKPGKLANEVTQALLPDCPYVFVHDDPTRKLVIEDSLLPRGLKIVRASDCYGDTIFDYIPLMEQAESCHFIDSSVALLWDRCAGKRRNENFIHRYVRADCTKPYYDKSYWTYLGGPVHRFRGRRLLCHTELI
tara:strand:+ start:572 stop:1489 length:918 start_codon:yes stop_codon:yes gene_type:complete